MIALLIDPSRLAATIKFAEWEPVVFKLRTSGYVSFADVTSKACAAKFSQLVAAAWVPVAHSDAAVYTAIGAVGNGDAYAVAAKLDNAVVATRRRMELLQAQGLLHDVTVWAAREAALASFLPPPGTALGGAAGKRYELGCIYAACITSPLPSLARTSRPRYRLVRLRLQ